MGYKFTTWGRTRMNSDELVEGPNMLLNWDNSPWMRQQRTRVGVDEKMRVWR